MATNLDIDVTLLEQAFLLGGKKTKKATVNEALREYVQYRKRLKMIDLFGKIDFHPDWNYKRDRKKR